MCNLYSDIDLEQEFCELVIREKILSNKGMFSFEELHKKSNNLEVKVLNNMLLSLRDSGYIEECGSKFLVL